MELLEENFDDIVNTMMPSVIKYCYGILINYHDAEDVAVQAFVKTYNVIERLEDISSLKAYLYKAAYTGCIDELRRKKRYNLLIDKCEDNFNDKAAVSNINYISDELAAALERLKPEERALVYSIAVEEKSYKEVSAVFGKSEATLRKRYERARRKLQNYYAGKEME